MPPNQNYDTHRREASARLRAELTAWIEHQSGLTRDGAAILLGVDPCQLSRWLDGPWKHGRIKASRPMDMSAGTRSMLRQRLAALTKGGIPCDTPTEPASPPPSGTP